MEQELSLMVTFTLGTWLAGYESLGDLFYQRNTQEDPGGGGVMDAKVSSSPFVSLFCLLASQTTTSPTPRYHFHSLTTLSSLSPPPPCMSAHHHYFFCFDPSLRGQITVWHICREEIQMHACVRGSVYVYVRETESERSEAEVKRK